ncbi:hypothetical protein FRB94_000459 [Tulasnella sp. JGI-2019a]|nr:hypothetical protein FRB94_000459 [Tulasnella sp. JGI-2019a]
MSLAAALFALTLRRCHCIKLTVGLCMTIRLVSPLYSDARPTLRIFASHSENLRFRGTKRLRSLELKRGSQMDVDAWAKTEATLSEGAFCADETMEGQATAMWEWVATGWWAAEPCTKANYGT